MEWVAGQLPATQRKEKIYQKVSDLNWLGEVQWLHLSSTNTAIVFYVYVISCQGMKDTFYYLFKLPECAHLFEMFI